MENFDVDFTLDSASIPEEYTDFSPKSDYCKFDVFLDALEVDYMTRLMSQFGNIHNHSIIRKGARHIQMPMPYVGDSKTTSGQKICCYHRQKDQWFKNAYMNFIIPMKPATFFLVPNSDKCTLKGKNYSDFLSMLLPIFQEKRNTHAMLMQRQSSAIASRMNSMYAAAWRAFQGRSSTNFAEFYHTQYEQPVIEAEEAEDVKEMLRFLLYIIVNFNQRLIVKQPDCR